MSDWRLAKVCLVCGVLAAFLMPRISKAAEATDMKFLRQIQREITTLKRNRARDQEEILQLQQKVNRLEGENRQLQQTNTQIKTEQAQTKQVVKQVQQKVAEGPSANQMSQSFGRYLGSHTFTVTGSAGIDFVYDQQSGALDDLHHASQNSFFLDWEPVVLYRPNDWMLFEGILEAAYGPDGTGTDLSSALFMLFPNDYVTIVGGLFDQPFGDWYETQSPMWINRFVTAPLPFGVEPVVPPGEAGLQVRGGFQWGQHAGQDFDYTLWGGDGISYSEPVLGAASDSPTPAANSETNGKSIGARFRIYPIPVDADMGRLELGVSTYNGKWNGGNWFTSWGVDFNYFVGHLQTRGEWLESYRQLPGVNYSDNRQGWYLQLGYFLNGIEVPFLPPAVNKYVQRLEPLIRYSGVNQHGVAIDDIEGATGVAMDGVQAGLVPDFGLNGSPALYAPHSREVALGLDYWIAPSIVWQNEFDIELPHAGGVFVSSDGTETPAGAIPNDHAFLSQFTIGF